MRFFNKGRIWHRVHGWLLEILTPEGNWCQDAVRGFPGHGVSVNLVVPVSAGRCIETVTLSGPDVDGLVSSIENHSQVESVSVTGRDTKALQARVTLRGCPVADLIRSTGLAPRLPFVVVPGRDIWMVLGQEDALRAARVELAEHALSSRMVGRGQWTGHAMTMTEHQRTVLTHAVQWGYYEYPRRINLTELARQLGVAKSTLSQTLMVIEMKLAFDFMERPQRTVEEHEVGDSRSRRGRRLAR